MRHYPTCLALALVTCAALWVFAAWTAGVATLATAAGQELSGFQVAWFTTANVILNWFILITAGLLTAALAIAARLRARADQPSD